MSLGDSEWVFAHDHLETPEIVAVGDGDRWVLVHGLCLYAGDDEREMTPAQRLAEAAAVGHDEFLNMLDLLGGRHVVLLGRATGYSLYQDATGMRSVFYSEKTALVSSHVHLINALQRHRRRADADGRRGFIRSLARTPFLGIDALIPNHSLSIPTWRIQRFFPRTTNPYTNWTIQKRVTEYIAIWKRQWATLGRQRKDLLFSITGGQDSRTTMSLVGDPMKTFRTFTYTVEQTTDDERANTLIRDVDIVEEIRKLFPLHNYTILTRKNETLSRSNTYDSLLAVNATRGHGAWLISRYADLTDDENTIHVRGNVYGLFKAHWSDKFPTGGKEEIVQWFMEQTREDQPYENKEQRLLQYVNGIKKWSYHPPLFGYHIFDLLYWEIRLGRWATEIYNETDIVFNSVDTANLRALLSIALSFTEEEKNIGLLQSEIINATCPVLNFPGKNTYDNLYEQTRTLRVGGSETILNPGVSRANLYPGAVVSARGIPVESLEILSSRLWIPADHFVPGREIARTFQAPSFDGDLSFSISNTYTRQSAQRSWLVQIVVDGQPLLTWDGTKRSRPVHVTVENIRKGMQIALHLIPRRDQRGKKSWEKATISSIDEPILISRAVREPVNAAADITCIAPE